MAFELSFTFICACLFFGAQQMKIHHPAEDVRLCIMNQHFLTNLLRLFSDSDSLHFSDNFISLLNFVNSAEVFEYLIFNKRFNTF